MAYRWNDQAGRFTDAQGRFVSEQAVRAVVNQVADHASTRMAAASQAMLDGTMSLGSWQAEMQTTIKLSQMGASIIANGGADQMTFATYGAAGQRIREQYSYLLGMADDIASGRQPLNGSLTSRARQYGQAARVAFEREYARTRQQRGYRFERNVLAPAEHCAQCREQTARGWVEIGTLIPVGQRTCRGNCRCRLVYAREAAQAA